MHVGSLVIDRCAVTLKGRKVRLDHPVRLHAYCGTLRDFQRLVIRRVLKQALGDSVQHKREKTRDKIAASTTKVRALGGALAARFRGEGLTAKSTGVSGRGLNM